MSNRLFGSDDDSADFIHGDLDADVNPYPPDREPVDAHDDPEQDDDWTYWSEVEQGRWDDDPNPYAGDHSEM